MNCLILVAAWQPFLRYKPEHKRAHRKRKSVCMCVLDCNVILWQPHPIVASPPTLPPFHSSPAQADADLLVCLWPLPSCAGGTPPSVLSFCPWMKQLLLSLFSHGSRRSVHDSTALAKAFSVCVQSVQHITRHSRCRRSTPVSSRAVCC